MSLADVVDVRVVEQDGPRVLLKIIPRCGPGGYQFECRDCHTAVYKPHKIDAEDLFDHHLCRS